MAKGLTYGLGLDLSGLSADLTRAATLIEGSAAGIEFAVDPGASAASAASEGLQRTLAVMSDRLGSALNFSAVGAQIASFGPAFDRVAGTIVEGFRRIDSLVSFPRAQAALKRLSSDLTTVSAVGVFRGGGEAAAKGLESVGARLRKLWDAGPVMSYWRTVETRGIAAKQAIKAFESVPSERVGPGFGRRIFVDPKPTRGQQDDAARYERAAFAVGNVRKAYLAAKLGAEVFGTVARASLTIASDYARVATTPITLLAAGYLSAKAAVDRIKGSFGVFGDVAGKTLSRLFGRSIAAPFQAALAPARVFTATVRGAGAAVGTLSMGVRSFGVQAAAAFGFVGLAYKAVEFLRGGVKAASDLNETVSATKQVFGASFEAVDSQARGLEKSFGVSRKLQLDAASAFGSIAQGAGYSEAASAQLGNTFTALAADFSSFKNLPFEEAAGKLRGALAGETEPLRKFGVVISDDAVKAEALRLGLATTTKEIDAQAKVTARASLIQQGLGAAIGDLQRTSDGAANQFRKAGGGLEAFGAQVGSVLLPAVTAGTAAFNDLLSSIIETFEANRGTLESWGASLAGVMAGVGSGIRNFGSYWRIAQISATQAVANVLAAIETLPENFAIVTSYLGRNWSQLLRDLAAMAGASFANLGANAANFGAALWDAIQGKGFNFEWTGLLEGFEATAEKFPELVKPAWVDMSADLTAEFDKIAAKEEARARNLAKIEAGPKPKGLDAAAAAASASTAAKKDDGPKLAAAVDAGSKEAYAAVAKALDGRGGRNEAAKLQREGNATQKQILEELKKKPATAAPAAPAFGF